MCHIGSLYNFPGKAVVVAIHDNRLIETRTARWLRVTFFTVGRLWQCADFFAVLLETRIQAPAGLTNVVSSTRDWDFVNSALFVGEIGIFVLNGAVWFVYSRGTAQLAQIQKLIWCREQHFDAETFPYLLKILGNFMQLGNHCYLIFVSSLFFLPHSVCRSCATQPSFCDAGLQQLKTKTCLG